ncbi:MAG TPA: hypothetical protein VGM59_00230 [Dongiaceae bacterium]|jgi:hypothetical protein
MNRESNAPDPGIPAPGAPDNAGLKLVLAWALVGIPLIWGVLETLQNALKLFQ